MLRRQSRQLLSTRCRSFSSSWVEVSREDKYAVVRLNRPPVNSLNTELIRQLTQTIKSLEQDPSCRGFILGSTSKKVFCAGLDISEMYKPTGASLETFWTALQELFLTLYPSPLISIAAIEGHSPAGGCLLALCCDERIMTSTQGVIGLNETRLGIVAPFWFQDALINTIGHRQSEKMLGLGLQYDGKRAKELNLVDESLPTQEVMDKAHERMKEWLLIPQAARQLTKQALRHQVVDKLKKQQQHDLEAFQNLVLAPKTQANLEKYLLQLKSKSK